MGESPLKKLSASNRNKLSALLQTSGLWRASSIDCHDQRQTPSGFTELDAELPGGGWPVGGLCELLHKHRGIGEFRLVMPGLAHLSQTQGRWILLVSPPYIPYPPALQQAGLHIGRLVVTRPANTRDYLWVMEKALASRGCSAVIAWPGKLASRQLRRLQVASKDGDCWGILFRDARQAANPSPAELRILLEPANRSRDNSAINATIIKRRGSWQSDAITLYFDDELQRPMPDFSEMQVHREQPQTDESLVEAALPLPEKRWLQ